MVPADGAGDRTGDGVWSWLTIEDAGKGFDVRAALERCNDPELMLASGRGLMLMRAFADEMFFNSTGNEVTLVLYTDGCVRSPLDQ